MKKNRKITTCNRLDLKTLGFGLIMLKISPDTASSCYEYCSVLHPLAFDSLKNFPHGRFEIHSQISLAIKDCSASKKINKEAPDNYVGTLKLIWDSQ